MKKKMISALLIGAMAVSMAAGCGQNDTNDANGASAGAEKTTAQEDNNQILFNGSSTLAPVITSIATDFFDTYKTWNAYDSSLPEEDIAIYVSAGGSGQGTKSVIDGTSTFGMVARSVKDEEKEAIKDEKEYQVGIDALTIAVNPENPVTSIMDDLSTEQIIALFSGEYKTWHDMDASLPAEDVVVITRDINGGAHEVFQKNIMKVNGVEPTKENILNGSYIIQRPLLLVGSGEPTAVQQAFLDVVLGEEGQKTVEEMGFIPMK